MILSRCILFIISPLLMLLTFGKRLFNSIPGSIKRTLTYNDNQKSVWKSNIDYIQEELQTSAVIGQFTELFTASETDYVALCPFHDDSNPSMRIFDSKGHYHCFACGAHGNAINYVMQTQSLKFNDAVKQILEMFPQNQSSSTVESNTNLRHRFPMRRLQPLNPTLAPREKISVLSKPEIDPAILQQLMELSGTYFRLKLARDPKSIAVHSHLRTRKLSNEATTLFGIGYAPSPSLNQVMPYLASRMKVDGLDGAALASPSLTTYLLSKGFSAQDLVTSGFTVNASSTKDNNVTKYYDRFR